MEKKFYTKEFFHILLATLMWSNLLQQAVLPSWSAMFNSGMPSTGRAPICWSKSRGGHQNDQRDRAPLL